MKRSAYVACALALAMMIALLVDPQRYARSVYDGMLLYAVTVMPTMLPFFFLSAVMTGTGIAGKFAKIKAMERVFHAPSAGLYVWIVAALSGYPVGAKLSAELYEQGVIDRQGVQKLISFTSTTGPLFILGTVGTSILHSYPAGLCMMAAHYLSSIANGLVFRGRKVSQSGAQTIRVVASDKLLWDAAYQTVISLFVAGVYIVCFNMFADVLHDVGAIGLCAKALSWVGIAPKLGEALGYGLCEMTRGCVYLSSLGLPLAKSAPLCCLLVTLGGGCVGLQSIAYLGKCGVKASYFLLCKITQAAFAFGFCSLFCLLL